MYGRAWGKEEEISQEEKDKSEDLNKKISEIESKKTEALKEYGKKNKLVKQVIDLAISNEKLDFTNSPCYELHFQQKKCLNRNLNFPIFVSF